ncbi:MAG: PocR ligand-binding domain-containing protein [Kiritimatiellae bacterium]|nr:PocR ligand-binding domain-containing protein [Kiritimatiellia bacterium]
MNKEAKRRQREEALCGSGVPVREEIDVILEPNDAIGTLSLGDIIDQDSLQSMMEDFYKLTNIGIAVLDISGNVLVAVGWQDICTKFHRCHPDTLKNCIESDTFLSSGLVAGEFKAYRCKNNMWDMVTPIEVGGRHMGNIFMGQFLYDDEMPDYDLFRRQARQYGFDEKEYLAALDRVPRLSREKADTAMTFYAKLAGMISSLGYSRINLSHALSRREAVLQNLKESESKLQKAQHIAGMGDFTWNLATNVVTWSDGMHTLLQYDKNEAIDYNKVNVDIHHPEDLDRVTQWLMDGIASGEEFLPQNEYRLIRKDGQIIQVQTNIQIEYQDGKAVRLFGTCLDITKLKQAEEGFRTSKERLSITLNSIADGVISTNEDGRIVHMNPMAESLCGWTLADAAGKPLAEVFRIVHAETREAVANPVKEVLEKGTTVALANHTVLISKNGSEYQIADSAAPIKTKKGEIRGVVLVFSDVTEKYANQKKIKESEKKYHSLFSEMAEGVYIHKMIYNQEGEAVNYRIIDANPASGKHLNIKSEEAIGKLATELFGTEEVPFLDIYEKVTKTGIHFEFEKYFHPMKKHFHISVYSLGNGKFGTVFADITERKRFEKELRERDEDLKETQRIAHVGSWHLDILTNEVTWSEELYKMYGFDPSLPPPSYSEHHTFFTPESWDRLSKALPKTIETGIPYELELETVQKDNRNGWIWVRGEVELDEKGATVGLRGAAQDITERKHIEEDQRKLQTQLIQAQKMESVGRLAGGVAHDFNNMLGVILGHADMIMEELDPALPIYADLEEISKAAQRSAALTRQLLAFARKQTVTPKVINLNETLEGMLQMLHRLIGEDIELVWRPGKDLALVKIDPSQVDQMLANLCVNARGAIADVGRITIETGTVVFDEEYCSEHVDFVPGEFVKLSVSDDGCGMDQETLAQIFEPFFTTKELGKGTGLGLATIYGIVKQNNGFVNVYSEPGQGTTFAICLPRYFGKDWPTREKCPAEPDAKGHETILLVEDEPAILEMTTMMLERLGYTVVAAGTPGEAICLAREYAGQIHLLMTDVVMPEMNGRELAKSILSSHPNLKRLFMSGYTADVIAHHGVLDEGVNFIQKPFSRKELGVMLHEIMEKE